MKQPDAIAIEPLLEVKQLSVEFLHRKGDVLALHDVSFSLKPGKFLASLANPVRVNH